MKADEINEAAQAIMREVEAAAKAMYEHVFTRPTDTPWEKCGPNWRQAYHDQATVALIAASKVNDEKSSSGAPQGDGRQG